MTDMPAFYPGDIIRETEARKSKGFVIHTLVLWTKHVGSLFREPLYSYLKNQQNAGTQLYVQLTITGIGRGCFITGGNNTKIFPEPCVPSMEESLSQIGRLINFTENPHRIRLRVDPLVRLKDADGTIFSNYGKLLEIASLLQPLGIKYFSFSFLEKGIYKKADNRFTRRGIEIVPPTHEERLKFANDIQQFAKNLDIIVSSCAVPGLPSSACIDGELLQKLHDEKWPVALSQPRSRELCGCTKSTDIGGWPPKVCNSGCLYCYSRPILK